MKIEYQVREKTEKNRGMKSYWKGVGRDNTYPMPV